MQTRDLESATKQLEELVQEMKKKHEKEVRDMSDQVCHLSPPVILLFSRHRFVADFLSFGNITHPLNPMTRIRSGRAHFCCLCFFFSNLEVSRLKQQFSQLTKFDVQMKF